MACGFAGRQVELPNLSRMLGRLQLQISHLPFPINLHPESSAPCRVALTQHGVCRGTSVVEIEGDRLERLGDRIAHKQR